MRFVEFQSFISGGATRPCLCRADTGDIWMIKVHGNPLACLHYSRISSIKKLTYSNAELGVPNAD